MIQLLDLFFPPRCAFCGQLLPIGAGNVCRDCENNLPYIEPGKILRKVGNHTCAVTFYYEDMVRSGIHALKFSGRSARAKIFAPYMVQTIAEELGGEFDAVTYVPISVQRRFRRGYDQTQLLARYISTAWGIRAEKTLRKIRNNPPQSGIRSFRERRENVQNVYALREDASIAGRRFLLLDDITTSGSTMIVCADLLLSGGAASVVCAAFAGGQREKSAEKGKVRIN